MRANPESPCCAMTPTNPTATWRSAHGHRADRGGCGRAPGRLSPPRTPAGRSVTSATPSRPTSPRPRFPSCAGSARPMSSPSTRPGGGTDMTMRVPPGDGCDPRLASGSVDPADLSGADHHERRRPAPVQPGLGRRRPRRRLCPDQHHPGAAEGPQPGCQPRTCWWLIPTTPAATSSSAAAELVTDGALAHLDALTPPLHPASGLLRHLPGPACAGRG